MFMQLFSQILMNVSWKKTCATLTQPVQIQMAVMSVLATMDSKEMALPTVQVSFCRTVPQYFFMLVYNNEGQTGFECSTRHFKVCC